MLSIHRVSIPLLPIYVSVLLSVGLALFPIGPVGSNTVLRGGVKSPEQITDLDVAIQPASKKRDLSAFISGLQFSNEIVQENLRPGNPASEWDINGGDSGLQGFATDISVNKGQTITFKIKTDAAVTAYHLDIYRMGYYNGEGARCVATVSPSTSPPQIQTACISDSMTGLTDCGNWAESASWTVPASEVSGVHIAKIVRGAHVQPEPLPGSHIIFVVRDDSGHSDLLFQTSDATWQAYNRTIGKSTYDYLEDPNPRALKVSYNRPFNTHNGRNGFFYSEYPMVRWLEANGYDISYFTGVDGDRRGSAILNHKVFLSVGHDEYWSGDQRANVETARNQGVNLAFFSGNEMFWKIRWESSIDGSSTTYRTLVVYKETHANAKSDPVCNAWSGTWRDPRFSPPGDGGRPENALTGQLFTVNDYRNDSISVSQSYGRTRFWRNTSFAELPQNTTGSTPQGTLGYEWDEPVDNGFLPSGLAKMSSTTLQVSTYLLDYGNNYGLGTATHHLTLYRQPGGGLVFGAGTVQWSWGLDDTHDVSPSSLLANRNMQQATVNLLADTGAQPGSLQPNLVSGSASTDTTPPSSIVSSPTNGATVQGDEVTISGTAVDSNGGVVSAVEVSVDGGTHWHPATGQETWNYVWRPTQFGSAIIKSRAVDDSGNTQIAVSSITITVAPPHQSNSIWTVSVSPAGIAGDPSAYELGVKFRSSVPGAITGVRYYKGAGNTGQHFGRLWDRQGNELAKADFIEDQSTGWQQVNFATPVPISADTTYIASYYDPNGHFAVSPEYFKAEFRGRFLRGLQDGEDGANSVYAYGQGFPTRTFVSTNYWVDVAFVPQSSLWTEPIGPAGIAGDPSAYELGVKFRSHVDGWVTGVRYYKGAGNTGQHFGRLWDTQGNELAKADFIENQSTGWQQVNFANPVPISAETTYIATYYDPNGHFAVSPEYFDSYSVENGFLKAPKDNDPVDGSNSVYAYAEGFPTQTFVSTNYWVDVAFVPRGNQLNSLLLNGAGAYVNVPYSASLNITGPLTLEAWIKTNSAFAQQGIIERYGQGPANDGGYALRLSGAGKLMFFTLQNNWVWDVLQGDTIITTGQWHHVAGVFDGQQLRVYVDGILDGSKLSTFTPTAGTTGVKIGARADDGAFSFNGLIDEARVTAAAVYCPNTNFTAAPKLTLLGNTTGLWKFDGRTTHDFSSKSNHGALVADASFSTSIP